MRSLAATYFDIVRHQLTNKSAAFRTATVSTRQASTQGRELRFDGQTAIVTGAGRGLGREYALLLAARGANVVVNDFGAARSGEHSESKTEKVAEQVVAEIQRLKPTGKAIANYDSVNCEHGAKRLVEQTVENFGRIDILINNAGILRDKSFVKMTIEDWDQVVGVHMRGSFLVSHACWPLMRKQEYGKIVMTSSTSGLYGNFGQANYAAAKMALIGLSNTLAIEGRKSNIQCNTVVPMAASRMTIDIIPDELARRLKAAYVAPLVAWLCHSECRESGGVFEAAGQWFGRHKLHRSAGKYLAGICEDGSGRSLERLLENWNEISSLESGATHVDSFADHLTELLRSIEN